MQKKQREVGCKNNCLGHFLEAKRFSVPVLIDTQLHGNHSKNKLYEFISLGKADLVVTRKIELNQSTNG